MQKMVWNVYYENFNAKVIESYNIFDHYSFEESVKNAYKKYKDDFAKFSEEVQHNLKYYFWSKCEWEILLCSLVHRNHAEEMTRKIDVYDQVMLNWNIFIKYVWEQAHARKLKGKNE